MFLYLNYIPKLKKNKNKNTVENDKLIKFIYLRIGSSMIIDHNNNVFNTIIIQILLNL